MTFFSTCYVSDTVLRILSIISFNPLKDFMKKDNLKDNSAYLVKLWRKTWKL